MLGSVTYQERENKNIKEEKVYWNIQDYFPFVLVCLNLEFQQNEHRLWDQQDLDSSRSPTIY